MARMDWDKVHRHERVEKRGSTLGPVLGSSRVRWQCRECGGTAKKGTDLCMPCSKKLGVEPKPIG